MSLSPDQQAALEQLWAVTASDSQSSRDRDERLLRDNNWDVQRTVELIFSSTEEPTSAGPSRSPTSTSEFEPMEIDDSETSLLHSDGRPQGRSRPRGMSGAQGRGGGVGTSGLGLWGFITFPVRLVMSVLTGTWYFLVRTFIPYSLLPRFPRFLLPPVTPTGSTTTRIMDPTGESIAYIRDLETFTGTSVAAGSLPDLYAGTYRDFLGQVRKQTKVGLVILMCGEHEDDEEFKRDVLVDPELVRTLKEKDIMVWAADIKSREGYQVSQTLLCTTYPSLTFLSLLPSSSTTNSTSSPKLKILTTIAGRPSTTTSSSSIIQTLTTTILPRATPFLNRVKREKLSLEEARHLRKEQDRAFKEAERKDREKAEATRQAAELERIKKERAEKEAAEAHALIQKRQQWRRYARKHLLPPSEGPVRVAMRTPLSSERVIRQFQPSSSTTPLFIFAETLLIPPSQTAEEDPDEAPESFEPEYDFRIVTAYPRTEIDRVETDGEAVWETVRKAGGALFAEKLEGGNWGDAELKELRGEDSDEEQIED